MFRFIGMCFQNAGSQLACASEPPTRESRATSTTRRAETSASAAKTRLARQDLLGRHSSILVRMATIPHCGHARNGGALAQGRIPFVLEADLSRWMKRAPFSTVVLQEDFNSKLTCGRQNLESCGSAI